MFTFSFILFKYWETIFETKKYLSKYNYASLNNWKKFEIKLKILMIMLVIIIAPFSFVILLCSTVWLFIILIDVKFIRFSFKLNEQL